MWQSLSGGNFGKRWKTAASQVKEARFSLCTVGCRWRIKRKSKLKSHLIMQHGQIPNDQDAFFLQHLHRKAQPNQTAHTDLRNSCTPSSVPLGSWQGSFPPQSHSFSTLPTQKSHFFSWNTIAPTASHGPPAWNDERFLYTNRKRARLWVHKHKELFLLRIRSCPAPFAVIILELFTKT